jgi:proteasome accessory factor B
MKLSRVSRVVRILTALQSGGNYSVDELSQLLGTSRRTVFRDLKQLEAIGVPYKYDTESGGYKVDPEFFLPPVDLNLREALSLLLLAHKTGREIQLPFRESALVAAMKIENNLPDKIRHYCSKSLRHISTRLDSQAPTGFLNETFKQLQKAIVDKKKVDLTYSSLFEAEDVRLELCPYHLIYNQRAWYVLGYSGFHKSVRTFKLNRIKDFKILDKCFLSGDDFDLDDYFGKAWKMIPEGRIYDIKLRFLPMVAVNVSEVQWHKSQEVRFQDDGSVIMEFRVDGLREIVWWIMGYGDQVQVLAPRKLRKQVVRKAEQMIENNKNVER